MSKKRPKRKKIKTRALESTMMEADENAMMPRARKRKVGRGDRAEEAINGDQRS